MHKRVFHKKRRRSSITCQLLRIAVLGKPELSRVPCDRAYAAIVYIGIAPSTPLLTKGRTSCCIYTNMHRRPHQSPSEQFLKFPRFQSVRRKRVNVVLIRYCQSPDLEASISLPAIQENDATKVTKRIGSAKLSGYFLHYWTIKKPFSKQNAQRLDIFLFWFCSKEPYKFIKVMKNTFNSRVTLLNNYCNIIIYFFITQN